QRLYARRRPQNCRRRLLVAAFINVGKGRGSLATVTTGELSPGTARNQHGPWSTLKLRSSDGFRQSSSEQSVRQLRIFRLPVIEVNYTLRNVATSRRKLSSCARDLWARSVTNLFVRMTRGHLSYCRYPSCCFAM
ncbi:hypothetical protein IscW_ISCW002285, partial [Ixodes scapularis]